MGVPIYSPFTPTPHGGDPSGYLRRLRCVKWATPLVRSQARSAQQSSVVVHVSLSYILSIIGLLKLLTDKSISTLLAIK